MPILKREPIEPSTFRHSDWDEFLTRLRPHELAVVKQRDIQWNYRESTHDAYGFLTFRIGGKSYSLYLEQGEDFEMAARRLIKGWLAETA